MHNSRILAADLDKRDTPLMNSGKAYALWFKTDTFSIMWAPGPVTRDIPRPVRTVMSGQEFEARLAKTIQEITHVNAQIEKLKTERAEALASGSADKAVAFNHEAKTLQNVWKT